MTVIMHFNSVVKGRVARATLTFQSDAELHDYLVHRAAAGEIHSTLRECARKLSELLEIGMGEGPRENPVPERVSER